MSQKNEPARERWCAAHAPWTVKVEGKVKQPKTFDIEALLKLRPLEDRVYRHRCVEAWSMVIPWVGYSLSEFIKECDPLPSAKYVQFLSYYDTKWRSGRVKHPSIRRIQKGCAWMKPCIRSRCSPLAFTAKFSPNQNGAPIRIVVPWKYGFKSAKSIVTVRFLEKEPPTTWSEMGPSEYGFYSNVNPNVDHPRWSQKTERRIGLAVLPAAPDDAHVQRLWRPGSLNVQRNGLEEEFLAELGECWRSQLLAFRTPLRCEAPLTGAMRR